MMQQAGGMDVNSLMQRLRRLAMLDTTVFDEVRGDANSTIPAIVVVAGGDVAGRDRRLALVVHLADYHYRVRASSS